MTKKPVVYRASRQDEVVRLRLVDALDGVRLIAVDQDGAQVRCGSLLRITSRGVNFSHSVGRELGFELDRYGSLRKV